MRRAGAAVLAILSALLATLALDWVAGVVFSAGRANTGLIWAAHSTVSHVTPEFHYTARINNLGFRGRDLNLRTSARTRVVVLGDSFTYGWGVAKEQSWPSLVESQLNAGKDRVEIANLGAPGFGPRQYADLAERAIPLLKPDVVIVALTQADDLLQTHQEIAAPATMRDKLRNRLYAFFPKILFLLETKTPLHVGSAELTATWKEQVDGILKQMSAEERARFDQLPEPIRKAYLDGALNPGILYYAIRYPRFLLEDRSSTRPLAIELTRIKEAADTADARLLVLSIPHRAYVSRREMEAMGRLGYEVSPEMIAAKAPDAELAKASREAGIRFSPVTARFRKRAAKRELYFPLDGHLNIDGHRFYAELIAPLVDEMLHER